MDKQEFKKKALHIIAEQKKLLSQKNTPLPSENGIFNRYQNPILTAQHVPVSWRFDFDYVTNPNLLERLGINTVFNCGAIKWQGKYCVIARVEGVDRKSFFAIAESPNGVDNFRFWDYPVIIPQTDRPDVNVYDMRLTQHEDGWIYGVFCTERKDPEADESDISAAEAKAGIVRTKDLLNWERLPDLETQTRQQRNVVLHPEFIEGKYAFYTRPQDDFIEAGTKGGISWGLSESMNPAVISSEIVVDSREYHTIYESKNGLGPAPIKTGKGWLHLAHGVRNTAAGLRYVMYMFLCDLDESWKIIHKPAGYFVAPAADERIGDVSNVVFSNGWIQDDDGKIFIYYASSDTRLHVITTTIDLLLDYVVNTPEDSLRSSLCVKQRVELITKNKEVLKNLI